MLKKVLAVAGLSALCATAAFADPAITSATAINGIAANNSSASVTLEIDAYAAMTFTTDTMDIHLSPDEGAAVGDTSNANTLHADANFDYQVTATLVPPTLATGDASGTIEDSKWTLNATNADDISSDSLVRTWTKEEGIPLNDTLTVSVNGIDLTKQWGNYTGGTVTVQFANNEE